MPTYEYIASNAEKACGYCRAGFDIVQKISEPKLEVCPECGSPIRKVVTCVSIGRSQSSLDERAKASGFTKLKRLGKGEYEKQY